MSPDGRSPRRRVLGALAAAMLLALGTVPMGASGPTSADVVCAEPATVPSDTASWGQLRMGAERVWPLTNGQVLVGLVDTGVSAAAPALVGAVLPGMTSTGQRGDEDCFGRGTFIASLIAGRPQGDSPVAGVAPGATIFPVRITNDPADSASSRAMPRLIGQGISAAVAAGARIVAVPLSTAVDAPEIRTAVDAAAAADVLVIASAHAPSADAVAFPASIDGVLAVSALGPDGPTQDALGAAPDLASPAEQLLGSSPAGPGHTIGSDPALAVGYVAGAAALVRAMHPELSAAQVIDRLRATADHASTVAAAGGGPDPTVGWGVVDPVAAVTRLDDPDMPPAPELGMDYLAPPTPPDHRGAIIVLLVACGAALAVLFVLGPLLAAAATRRRPLDPTRRARASKSHTAVPASGRGVATGPRAR